MEYYNLNHDVYVVDGIHLSAIYDLNTGNLYSINQVTRDLIAKLVASKSASIRLKADEKSIVESLLREKVLIPSSDPGKIENIQKLKRHYPVEFAWIEVTRQCNMACPFCYESSSPNCYERMTINDFDLAVKNLKEIGVKRIQFIGGEPTLLKDELKKMIEHCRADFDFIEVYSNGMLIDTHWCEFFKKNRIHVALSIHSYINEEHDKHVNYPGSHKKVVRAVNLLKDHGIEFRVGTVKSKGCKLGGPDEQTNYRIQRQDNPRITGRADIDQYDFEMFKSKAITKDKKRFPLNKKMVSRFVSGHQCFLKDVYINTKLDIFPCVMERRISYGNLKEKPLSQMIDNDLRFLSKDHVEGCKDCEYRYACFDCRPDSNGRGLYQKPWFCSYNPKTGEWQDLQIMFEGLKKTKSRISSIPVIVAT